MIYAKTVEGRVSITSAPSDLLRCNIQQLGFGARADHDAVALFTAAAEEVPVGEPMLIEPYGDFPGLHATMAMSHLPRA